MNYREAHKAIEEILASIPNHELPEFDRVEFEEDGMPVVWWASSGHHLGKARSNRHSISSEMRRDPLVYRHGAATDAIHQEMIYRADQLLLNNGDNPEGLDFKKMRRVVKSQAGDLRDGAINTEAITNG